MDSPSVHTTVSRSSRASSDSARKDPARRLALELRSHDLGLWSITTGVVAKVSTG